MELFVALSDSSNYCLDKCFQFCSAVLQDDIHHIFLGVDDLFFFFFSFLIILQVRVFTGPRCVFCELRDRGRPGGLWDGVIAVARVTALHHTFDACSLCCRKKIHPTGKDILCFSSHFISYCTYLYINQHIV